jgi:hypothetical protein
MISTRFGPIAWFARSVRLTATRLTPARLDHRLACGKNSICPPSLVGLRRRIVIRWMPLLVDTSAVEMFENGIISSARPLRTFRRSSQSITSSARRWNCVFRRKYTKKELRMPTANKLDTGFCRRLSSSTERATTNAINAAALSQIPRLNKIVFLNEMTCISKTFSTSPRYQRRDSRTGALRGWPHSNRLPCVNQELPTCI